VFRAEMTMNRASMFRHHRHTQDDNDRFVNNFAAA
jgi:hypothetical protein